MSIDIAQVDEVSLQSVALYCRRLVQTCNSRLAVAGSKVSLGNRALGEVVGVGKAEITRGGTPNVKAGQ